MKKLITLAVAILLTACMPAFASGKPAMAVPQKQFDYQMTFEKVVLSGDIELNLKESDDKIISLEGKDADIENVDWKIKGDILYISSKRGSLKEKVKVTINVSQLKESVVRGKSTVNSRCASFTKLTYLHQCRLLCRHKKHREDFYSQSFDTELDVKKISGDIQLTR